MELICNCFGIGCVLMVVTIVGGFVAGNCSFGYVIYVGGTFLRMALTLFETADDFRRNRMKRRKATREATLGCPPREGVKR